MPISVKVELGGLKRYRQQLEQLNRKGVAYAEAATLNDLAFGGRKVWQKNIPAAMTVRSPYTVRSVQVDKANPRSLQAALGSVADYMATQEDGAVEPKKGARGVPIPAASPGKRKARGRTPKRSQLASISLLPTVRGHKARQVGAALAMAKKRGGVSYAFLQLGKRRQGIYRLDPSKKRAAIRKVWDLSKGSVHIPENPTMKPAVLSVVARRDRYWAKNLAFQLRRVGAR